MKRTVTVINPELAEPHKATRERQRLNLGTRLQKVIHAVIDVTPLAAETKEKIKNCGGCGDRVKYLDKF